MTPASYMPRVVLGIAPAVPHNFFAASSDLVRDLRCVPIHQAVDVDGEDKRQSSAAWPVVFFTLVQRDVIESMVLWQEGADHRQSLVELSCVIEMKAANSLLKMIVLCG